MADRESIRKLRRLDRPVPALGSTKLARANRRSHEVMSPASTG